MIDKPHFKNAWIWAALQFLQTYEGKLPMHIALKNFLAKEKKYGSKDRKGITALCYKAMRLRIFHPKTLWTFAYLQEIAQWQTSLTNKLDLPDTWIFQVPWTPGIEKRTYAKALFEPRAVFFKFNPLKATRQAVQKLSLSLGLDLYHTGNNIYKAPANTSLESFVDAGLIMIQDMGSQMVCQKVKPYVQGNYWDACAASGGKSLHFQFEKCPIDTLIVSDIRASILHNLKSRFKLYGYPFTSAHVIDLSSSQNIAKALKSVQFDTIIADVPCSGSGTWLRTPEQFTFTKANDIETYSALQYSIASNALMHLKAGGTFIYCTCSLFSQENEYNVQKLCDTYQLTCIEQNLIDTSKEGGDVLYYAILRKS